MNNDMERRNALKRYKRKRKALNISILVDSISASLLNQKGKECFCTIEAIVFAGTHRSAKLILNAVSYDVATVNNEA